MDQPQVMRANGTIIVSRFVKIDSADSNSVLACGANERVFGVAQEASRTAPTPDVAADPAQAAVITESVMIYTPGRTCLLMAAGSFNAGALLKSNADGDAVVCAETAGLKENSGAIALEAGAAGRLTKVLVWPFTVTTET